MSSVFILMYDLCKLIIDNVLYPHGLMIMKLDRIPYYKYCLLEMMMTL